MRERRRGPRSPSEGATRSPACLPASLPACQPASLFRRTARGRQRQRAPSLASPSRKTGRSRWQGTPCERGSALLERPTDTNSAYERASDPQNLAKRNGTVGYAFAHTEIFAKWLRLFLSCNGFYHLRLIC